MIGKTLVFLRKQLDDYLRQELGGGRDNPVTDKVVFLDGDKMDPIVFASGAVSQLLVNVEEERTLRSADRFSRPDADGKPRHVQPDIRLMLYVLFVARFKQYDAGWEHLAKILEFLQTHPTFEPADTTDMPAGLDRLTLELVTQSFSEQNEVWSALKSPYHPSLLYRAKLVVVRDTQPAAQSQVTRAVVDVRNIQ